MPYNPKQMGYTRQQTKNTRAKYLYFVIQHALLFLYTHDHEITVKSFVRPTVIILCIIIYEGATQHSDKYRFNSQ